MKKILLALLIFSVMPLQAYAFNALAVFSGVPETAAAGGSNYALTLSGDAVYYDAASGMSTFGAYGLMNFSEFGGTDKNFISIMTGAGVTKAYAQNNGSNQIEIMTGVTTICTVEDAISEDTTYLWWFDYSTSGTTSFGYVAKSVGSTKPSSGTKYCSNTNGATDNVQRLTLAASGGIGSQTGSFDTIKVDSAAIGSSGACDGACLFEEEFDGSSLCATSYTSNCDLTWTVNTGAPDFQGTDLE